MLIINNYYKKKNQSKVYQIVEALKRVGKSKHQIWRFSEISEKRIPDDVGAILLSGSSASLLNKKHRLMYRAEIELVKQAEVPVLGICFGHQIIGKAFGVQIHNLSESVRGFKEVKIVEPDESFSSWSKGTEIKLKQNHKDCVASLPKGFILLAKSKTCEIEAMKHRNKPIYGVQAHIERATDEKPAGWQVLEDFITHVNLNIEQRKIVGLVERFSRTSKSTGKGKRFSWNTFNGRLTCNVVKTHLKKNLRTNLKVVGPPAFIKGSPTEFDLLVVDGKSRSQAFIEAYEGEPVRVVIEVKSHGTYSQDALRRIKAIFDNIVEEYSAKCVYLAIRDSGKPKRKGSKNWIKITKEILSHHDVFVLCDSRTKEYYPNQWSNFIKAVNSAHDTHPT